MNREITEAQDWVVRSGSALQALNFARFGADVQALQMRVLAVGSCGEAFYFARDIEGADIGALQARVLSGRDGNVIYRFAKEVAGADAAACEARLLQVGAGAALYLFAREIGGANVLALYSRAKSSGFAYLSSNIQQSFSALCAHNRRGSHDRFIRA